MERKTSLRGPVPPSSQKKKKKKKGKGPRKTGAGVVVQPDTSEGRGDFDVLLVHQQHGYVLLEIKVSCRRSIGQ